MTSIDRLTDRPGVFFSYSHDDVDFVRRFYLMLRRQQPPGEAIWWDDKIRPGDKWREVLHDALDRAVVAVLFVSLDFLESEFISKVELPRLRKAEVKMLPILVRACPFESNEYLGELQFLVRAAALDLPHQGERDQAILDATRALREDLKASGVVLPSGLNHEDHGGDAPLPGGVEGAGGGDLDAGAGSGGSSVGSSGKTGWEDLEMWVGSGGSAAEGGAAGAADDGFYPPVSQASFDVEVVREPLPNLPELPPDFVARDAELGPIVDMLLAEGPQPRGITGSGNLGVHGQGGIGKTVLANAAARIPQVRKAFPGGVHWISVGERPDLVQLQRRLLGQMGESAESVETVAEGQAALREAMASGDMLVVVDDVWGAEVAEAFATGDESDRVLFTTRDATTLAEIEAEIWAVGTLDENDARDLLASARGSKAGSESTTRIIQLCDGVALAVAVIGAAMRAGLASDEAIRGLERSRGVYGDHLYAPVFAALDVACDAMDEVEAFRLHALGIFPEDVEVPVSTVMRLWSHADFAGARTSAPALLQDLAHRNLVIVDPASQCLRLHDLTREYLLWANFALADSHERLLATHEPASGAWADLDPTTKYLPDYLIMHLAEAGRFSELEQTVRDVDYLAARIHRGGVWRAVADLKAVTEHLGPDSIRGAIVRELRRSAPRFEGFAAPEDSWSTLVSHLGGLVEAGRPPAAYGLRVRHGLTHPTAQARDALTGHGGLVWGVAWSPDGARIASAGGHDATVRIWDAGDGTPVGEPLRGHEDGVSDVAWSPDGTRIASAGGHDATVRIWDAGDGTPVGEPLRGHEGSVVGVAWSPDGTRIASAGGHDATVRIWDAGDGTPVGEPLRGHEGSVVGVAWSPDGARIASAGGHDATVRIWDASDGTPVGEPLPGHEGPVLDVAWSPDGTRIASGGVDTTVRMWDAGDGTPVGEPLRGHWGEVWGVAWSPDGTRIASGGVDTTVRMWDAGDGTPVGEPLRGHGDGVLDVAWSPDGARIASAGGHDATVRIWDAGDGTPVGEPLPGHGDRVLDVAWSPDGTRIASGGVDTTVRIWDAGDGTPVGEPLRGHGGTVVGVAWSPDGTRIASGGGDGTVRIWDAGNGTPVGEPLRGHGGEVWGVAWSPDGTRIASGGGDGTVRIWDAGNGTPVGEPLRGHGGEVWGVAWSPDGTRIVSGGVDTTVRIWDAGNGTPVGEPLRGHGGEVWGVAWSPDGTRIASAGVGDKTVRIWNAGDGTPVGEPLRGHEGSVLDVAWSPDGTRIASGGGDGTVRIWDADRGDNVLRLNVGFAVTSAHWSSPGLALGVESDVAVAEVVV